MTEMTLKDGLSAMEVAAFLREHPSFLKDFPDLSMQLKVPRERGPAASLAGYQLETLRASNAAQTQRLAELVEIAGENQRLMVQVHSFTLALMRASTLEQTVRAVVGGLTEDFGTDHVRLVLFKRHEDLPAAQWLAQSDGAADWPAFSAFLDRHEPLCGRLSPEKLDALFADAAAEVHSVALMRLGHAGMLAVGSSEPNRFHPGIGTVFLKLIGEAVTTALVRFHDDD